MLTLFHLQFWFPLCVELTSLYSFLSFDVDLEEGKREASLASDRQHPFLQLAEHIKLCRVFWYDLHIVSRSLFSTHRLTAIWVCTKRKSNFAMKSSKFPSKSSRFPLKSTQPKCYVTLTTPQLPDRIQFKIVRRAILGSEQIELWALLPGSLSVASDPSGVNCKKERFHTKKKAISLQQF